MKSTIMGFIGIFLVLAMHTTVFIHEASAFANPQNGVVVKSLAGGEGLSLQPFTNFDPSAFGTATVYNDAGETDADAGKVNIGNMKGKKTMSISILTMMSTSIRIDVWGQLTGGTTWYWIYGFTYTGVTEDSWPISEYSNKIRFSTTVVGPVSGDDITVLADLNERNE